MKRLLFIALLVVFGCEDKEKDCAGVEGGTAYEDECGGCDANVNNDCTQDCADEWGGTAEEDICGVCNGDGTSCYGCTDPAACNFDANATIFDNSCFYPEDYEDNCGVCDLNPSNDCTQDCADEWGGTTSIDCAGECGGTMVDNNSDGFCDEWVGLTVTDIDGNVYQSVQIGEQLWITENLKVTHYNNGDEIQYVQQESAEPDVWNNLSTGAYGYYNDDLSHQETYGNLYNWYAVETGNLSPEGWHVPTDDEIKQLEMYLGMSQSEADDTALENYWRGTDEGSKLAGRADLWNNGELENDPEFGTSEFDFLPGGYRRFYDDYYNNMGNFGRFWSSTESDGSGAWDRMLDYDNSGVNRYYNDKRNGLSVRCIRD